METYRNIVDEFNKLIARLNDAERWFKNNPDSVEEKHINKVIELTKEGSKLAKEIKRLRGRETTTLEAYNGIDTYEL